MIWTTNKNSKIIRLILFLHNNLKYMDGFAEFILEHENDDVAKLLLAKDRYAGVDMQLAANTILSRRKLKNKLPSWYAEPSLIYPEKLSAEQCSSSGTAEYKARVIERLAGKGCRVADLTGGLGADTAAFSRIAEKVLYNEMNPALADAAVHNFRILGIGNVEVCNFCVCSRSACGNDRQRSCATVEELLVDFSPDVIFLDPARRADDGKKVFMMEDCRPDVLALKEELLEMSGHVVVKLSPMADISMIVERLGGVCREIHIISSAGECKELLVVLDRDLEGECRLYASCGGNTFSFRRSEEKTARAVFPGSEGEVAGAEYLFEPNKSIMKAGAYNLVCERFGLTKLGLSTHYYIAGADADTGMLGKYGKVFIVREVLPLNNRNIKKTGTGYPKSEVTARNIRMTSDQLRTRLGVRSGDDAHIFGLRCDIMNASANYLFVTSAL